MTDIFLYSGEATASDVKLRDPTIIAGGVTVTPVTLALVLATFAAVVTVTAHVVVTPAPATLSLATFAPTVTASDHKTVTPGAVALSLSTFAPTVTASDNITVTPDTATLVLTTFAPSISYSDNATSNLSAGSGGYGKRGRGQLWQTEEEVWAYIELMRQQLAGGRAAIAKQGASVPTEPPATAAPATTALAIPSAVVAAQIIPLFARADQIRKETRDMERKITLLQSVAARIEALVDRYEAARLEQEEEDEAVQIFLML